MQYLCY